jgi:hypothetical protein
MKTLTIKQPWAELILSGKKKVEIRSRNTKFRGEFLIHSSKNPDKNAMKFFGFENLPNGCILGKANLIDVKKYNDKGDFLGDKNLHLADSDFGNYGFVLGSVRRIKPIPAKGKLNFWEFDV